jgi:hypothetical protein
VANPTNWTAKSVASAATPSLPVTGSDFSITGTTGISGIAGGWLGREVALFFTGVLTFTSSAAGTTNAVRLNANTNMTTANGSVLKLRHNGVQWFEVGRSA